MAGEAETLELDGRDVRLSSPGKVLFAERGETKRDLVEYYLRVGEPLLRTMGGRPVLMQRFPHGAGGASFFQKRVPDKVPEWLETTTVMTVNGTPSRALVAADVAHVAWAVNLACLGFHVWPNRAEDPEHADELRLDLDPQPGTDFGDVIEAAGEVRAVLDELGFTGYPKTSGGRGVHVYVRVAPRWTFTEVRRAVIALARQVERRRPDLVTTAWWKEERGTRVFVDFNQMARDRTIACAYSLRANGRATASAPVTWDELPDVEPDDFDLRTVPERFARIGDPHATIDDRAHDITPLLEWAERDERNGQGDMPYPPEHPKMPGEPKRVQPSRDADRDRTADRDQNP